ncbi:MAG: glycoside hydrolase family 18 protein, partial [Acholeplasmatales bacterium]|nr:glycoside hydrolase family 18 protein [Acholeplasmatales bacterium]
LDMDANGDLVLCDEYADFQITTLPELDGINYGAPYAGVLGAIAILRIKNPHVKIGISVGGWTRSGDFPAVAADETKRKNFAKNIVKFIDYLGYDFVDIDWEYPTAVRPPDPSGSGVDKDEGCPGTPEDTEHFTLLLQEIRNELDIIGQKNNRYYELSVAMSASRTYMSKIEYDKVLKIVDYANMMTYDLNGAWNAYTGHHTALYTNEAYNHDTMTDAQNSVENCISYLEETYGNSIDYKKIIIGVAPYTRGWGGVKNDGLDPNNPGLYASADPNSIIGPDGTKAGSFPFYELPSLMQQYGLQEYFDDTAKAAYYYNPSGGYFFTCDNEKSVAAKGDYVKRKGLGGLIAWMASLDAENVITKAMFDSLYDEGYEFPDQEIVYTNIQANANIQVIESGYQITISNEETAEETNTALKDAELFKKSILNMKLYIKSKSKAKFSPGSMSGTVVNEDGVGIIDPSSIYDARNISPKGYYTFTIKVDGVPDLNDIESLTMTQRIIKTLPEIKKQVLYGN